MSSLEGLLDAEDLELWHRYWAQREKGLRRQALATLNALVAALLEYSSEQRQAGRIRPLSRVSNQRLR